VVARGSSLQYKGALSLVGVKWRESLRFWVVWKWVPLLLYARTGLLVVCCSFVCCYLLATPSNTRWESNIKEATRESTDYCSRVTLTRGLLTRVQRVAPVIGWGLVSDRWICVKW
jgi:hypothetical protein